MKIGNLTSDPENLKNKVQAAYQLLVSQFPDDIQYAKNGHSKAEIFKFFGHIEKPK